MRSKRESKEYSLQFVGVAFMKRCKLTNKTQINDIVLMSMMYFIFYGFLPSSCAFVEY